MTDLNDRNAGRLARLLFDIERQKRLKIISCLDTDFQVLVLNHLSTLKRDMPFEMRNNAPPGKVPNCS